MRNPAAKGLDPESADWLDALRADGAPREGALARLHDLLLGIARAEASRRRGSLPATVIGDLDAL